MPQLKFGTLPVRTRRPTRSPQPTQTHLIPLPREILLPSEIITSILQHLPPVQPPDKTGQKTLWACALISRPWYAATIALLYATPYLHGGNFNQFADAICPSKNAKIRRSTLSPLVRRLDMGDLVHNASKSLTARLLGRLKGNLEEFIAPQSSFAINSLAALSKCVRLKELNLSLISASIPSSQLFQTLAPLENLEILYFPRSSGGIGEAPVVGEKAHKWPPRLRALHLAGGIDDHFLTLHLPAVPATLERLSIQSCTQVSGFALMDALEHIGPHLQHLTLLHPLPKLFPGSLDLTLTFCTSLLAFRVSADYISNTLFSLIPQKHPLQILDLCCSLQAGADVEIDSERICEAVTKGCLSDLRSVRVSPRLAWAATEGTKAAVGRLVELLEDAEEERPLGVQRVGVRQSSG